MAAAGLTAHIEGAIAQHLHEVHGVPQDRAVLIAKDVYRIGWTSFRLAALEDAAIRERAKLERLQSNIPRK